MVRHRKCRSMGVMVPDFTSHMPMLHSSRTFSLPRLIVERHEETSTRLPKLVRASAAPHHPIHLSVTSQTERDITSTFLNLITLGMAYDWRDSCSTAQTVLDPMCSNQGVMESYEVVGRGPSSQVLSM